MRLRSGRVIGPDAVQPLPTAVVSADPPLPAPPAASCFPIARRRCFPIAPLSLSSHRTSSRRPGKNRCCTANHRRHPATTAPNPPNATGVKLLYRDPKPHCMLLRFDQDSDLVLDLDPDPDPDFVHFSYHPPPGCNLRPIFTPP